MSAGAPGAGGTLRRPTVSIAPDANGGILQSHAG